MSATVSHPLALTEFLSTIREHEAIGGYDYSYFLTDEKVGSIEYVDFLDFIEFQNSTIAADGFAQMSQDLGSVFISGSLKRSTYVPEFLAGDAIDVRLIRLMPAHVQTSFNALLRLNGAGPAALEQAAESIGGLFNLTQSSLEIQALNQQTNAQLASISAQLAQIRTQLIGIDANTTELLYDERRATLQAQAAAFEQSLTALKDKMAAESVGSVAWIKAVTSAGSSVGSGVAKISDPNVDVSGFGSGLGSIIDGISALTAAFTQTDFGPDIQKVSSELVEVQQRIAEIDTLIVSDRERLRRSSLDALASQYNANMQKTRVMMTRIGLADQLIKTTVTSFFSDAARSKIDLQQNLLGIETYIEGSDAVPFWAWHASDGDCTAATVSARKGCMHLGPQMRDKVILAEFPLIGSTLSLPVYEVAKSGRTLDLPTYGLKLTLR